MSKTLYTGTEAVTVQLDIGFGSGLFADPAGITWVDCTDDLTAGDVTLSSRTNELDDFQPGTASFSMIGRARKYDPAYGPASVTFDGSGSDYWGCGDLAAFSGATELDVRACVNLDDWTPAAVNTIAAQWNSSTNQRCWHLFVDASGYLGLQTSTTGTGGTSVNSGCRIAGVDGQTVCVRATWVSSGDVYFYVKRTIKGRERADCLDHNGWLQLGPVKTGVTAALFNSTAVTTVGDREGTTLPLDGSVIYADARTTIGGDTLVFAFWPKDAASTAATSWVASAGAGETWTKTGTSTITPQGTYFGQLVPGTPIRYRATYGGSTRSVFTGYVRRWPQTYPSVGLDAVARIEAADALAWLAEMECPATPFGIAVAAEAAAALLVDPTTTPDLYWPLHEPFPASSFGEVSQGNPGGNYIGTTAGVSPQPGAPGVSVRAFPTVADRAWSREGSLPPGPGVFYSPTLCFWVYVPTATAQFEVVVGGTMAYVNNGPGGLSYAQSNLAGSDDVMFVDSLPAGAHFLQIQHSAAGTLSVIVDGSVVATRYQNSLVANYSSYPELWITGYSTNGGASISDVIFGRGFQDLGADAYYSGSGRPLELSGSRMAWLLTAAGIPSALIDCTTDQSTYLGPMSAGGTFLSQAKEIETAEGGRLFVNGAGVVTFRSSVWATTATAATTAQGTFGDGEGNPPYSDITLDANNVDDIVNTATVSIPSGGGATAHVAESVRLYGVHPVSRTAPLTDTGAAHNLAIRLANTRPWPTTRVEGLKLDLRSPGWGASLWPQALDRAIGERIVVNRRPTSTLAPASTTSTIAAAVTIEGIRHVFTLTGWSTTWTTAPAPLTAYEAGLFTADDAVLSQVDAGIVVA